MDADHLDIVIAQSLQQLTPLRSTNPGIESVLLQSVMPLQIVGQSIGSISEAISHAVAVMLCNMQGCCNAPEHINAAHDVKPVETIETLMRFTANSLHFEDTPWLF